MRLLNTALNADDSAHIYIRNSIFENLMNFYTSPLADNETKRLIIQVLMPLFGTGTILIFLLYSLMFSMIAKCKLDIFMFSVQVFTYYYFSPLKLLNLV